MHLSHFIKQKSYERVEYALRRHWLTFLPTIIFFVFLLAIPVGVYYVILNFFPELLSGGLSYPILILVASIYYLSVYLFFYAHFIDYYLDLWIITNDRIVDIEQRGLFNRIITELDLFRVQDVTSNVKGIIPTIFRYGDLTITTASSNTSIVFHKIYNPDHIRQEVIRLADEDRKYHLKDIKSEM